MQRLCWSPKRVHIYLHFHLWIRTQTIAYGDRTDKCGRFGYILWTL